ncbi:MAG: hypothetical protein HY787_08295, partial [Deltaproteobacteria bacterium]|nr:hypothetical protein [Deltaproteobacteria bacterium]
LKIMVRASQVKRNFLRTLLGEGLIMGFGYMWDEKNRQIWPGLMEKILQLKSDFFGHLGGPGIWVHDYHWKKVIGPMEKRSDPPPRFHGLDSINGLVGTHEYGLMLEEYRRATNRDILGSIQVNIMTGTPEEAADWVEYMNGSPRTRWGGIRAENGHRDPFRIQYWELGNQPHYTFFNVGRLTGAEYARRVRAFTTAMKERDPSIKVTAYLPFFAFDGSVEEALKIGTAIEDVPGGPGSSGLTWTRLVLKEAGNLIDALDYHWYGAVNSRAVSYEFIMSSAFKGLLPNIERARGLVRQYAPTDEARERLSTFVCPEYGGLSNNPPVAGIETATAVFGAVASSRLLHLFFDLDDLLYAARFGLFAPYPEPPMPYEMRIPYAAILGRADGSDFLGTAMYEMKRLWAKAHLPKILEAEVTGAPKFSNGISVLDVTAMGTDDGQALSLILTNTGQKEIRPDILIQDFKPLPIATRWLVSGDLNDDNRWEKRNKVVIQESEIQTGSLFTLPLPAHSITAVMMKRE